MMEKFFVLKNLNALKNDLTSITYSLETVEKKEGISELTIKAPTTQEDGDNPNTESQIKEEKFEIKEESWMIEEEMPYVLNGTEMAPLRFLVDIITRQWKIDAES